MRYLITYDDGKYTGRANFHYVGPVEQLREQAALALPGCKILSVASQNGTVDFLYEERVSAWRLVSIDDLNIGETLKQALREAGLLTLGAVADYGNLEPLKYIGPAFARRIGIAMKELQDQYGR